VRWRRWIATAIGFVGIIVMLRPEAGAFTLPMRSRSWRRSAWR
jgi:drug/metabolite transporter (DMT)-like permease